MYYFEECTKKPFFFIPTMSEVIYVPFCLYVCFYLLFAFFYFCQGYMDTQKKLQFKKKSLKPSSVSLSTGNI